jgi:hypothetical protein
MKDAMRTVTIVIKWIEKIIRATVDDSLIPQNAMRANTTIMMMARAKAGSLSGRATSAAKYAAADAADTTQVAR